MSFTLNNKQLGCQASGRRSDSMVKTEGGEVASQLTIMKKGPVTRMAGQAMETEIRSRRAEVGCVEVPVIRIVATNVTTYIEVSMRYV